MDLIKFLQTTEKKNINSYIGMKVKEKLKEYDEQLRRRQHILRGIFEVENSQFNGELVQLLNEKLNEQSRKRLDWLHAEIMERSKAEAELLKLKNQQRELENCEAWRHLKSKQLLFDSKRGQAYQIEDKKNRMAREKEIDKMWCKVMERLICEKAHQELYESQLRKIIMKSTQSINQEANYNKKKQKEMECQQAKKEFQEENQKTLLMEEYSRKYEKNYEILKKKNQNQALKSQIATNIKKVAAESQQLLEEERLQREIDHWKSLSELQVVKEQKIRNKEWNKLYLNSALKEKHQKLKEGSEMEKMYLNSGCVLQQVPKRPYGKNTR